MRHVLIAASLLWPVSSALAGSVDDLKRFLVNTQTLKADFSQLVVSKSGRRGQQSSGVVSIARPGRLRWELGRPYPYLLVSDGEKVWGFDPDLKQATVRKAGQALGSTPASLLAGNNDLERNFTLKDGGDSDGLMWVDAIPKNPDGGFGKLRLGLSEGELRAMELADQLGQVTYIRFSKLERNQPIAPATFRFVPPPGTDVVGD